MRSAPSAAQVDDLRRRLRGSMKRAARAAGIPPRTEPPLNFNVVGGVDESGPYHWVCLIRPPHPADPDRARADHHILRPRGFARPSIPRALIESMRREMRKCTPLLLRDAAIRAAGGDPMNPPHWAFAMHPASLALIAHAGIEIPAVRYDETCSRTRTITGGKTANDPATGWPTGCRIVHQGDRLVLKHLMLRSPSGAFNLGIQTMGQHAHLFLVGDYPDAVRASLKGAPLHQVADVFKPGTPAGECRVTAVRRDPHSLVLRLEDIAVPISPAPPGTDESWRSESVAR